MRHIFYQSLADGNLTGNVISEMYLQGKSKVKHVILCLFAEICMIFSLHVFQQIHIVKLRKDVLPVTKNKIKDQLSILPATYFFFQRILVRKLTYFNKIVQ